MGTARIPSGEGQPENLLANLYFSHLRPFLLTVKENDVIFIINIWYISLLSPIHFFNARVGDMPSFPPPASAHV
jgi:hypothetical protein